MCRTAGARLRRALKWILLGNGEPVELVENKSDVVTGTRVGEQTSSREFWTYCSLLSPDGRLMKAWMRF